MMIHRSEYSMLTRYFLAGEREAHLLGVDIELQITQICDKIKERTKNIKELPDV